MTPSPQTTASSPPTPPRDKTKLAALGILVLTAVIALLWSHVKLLSQDEIFVLQTDSVSSVHQLIHIQRNFPISLDPLAYHLLAHAATRLLGPTPLALRLPSILGFLLMQLCVFFITRRIAGSRAALVTMAFPALTATLFYAPEARPYGLLLGLYALTFLAWQTATRRAASREPRTAALILLALTIALTLNTHYFGILLLVPLCLAEFARTLRRRRFDLPIVLAILIGIAGIYGTLPFQPAASQFRKHYYNAGAITFHAISQAYRSLFVNYSTAPLPIQRLADALLILFTLALIALTVRTLRRSTTINLPALELQEHCHLDRSGTVSSSRGVERPAVLFLPTAELVFLLALAALPLFGVLLALFVTHSIEVRYVLSAFIAISIFVAIALEPWLRSRKTWPALLTLLILAIIAGGYIRIRAEQQQTTRELASLILPPAIKAQLFALPDSHLYIQDMGHFEVASYYEPDPEVRSHIALLYSRAEELRYDRHDTASLTAEHMRHFTAFTIVSYAQLQSEPGAHLLVLYHSGWDWTDQALAADAQTTPLGPALFGDAVLARFTALDNAPSPAH